MAASAIDADVYFNTHTPPANLKQTEANIKEFVHKHSLAGKRVVLITSGGTTVPLENQTVRFIDNFSAGTRGATSAEYFLEAGYAVIFMHRQFSLQPYSRHYTHSVHCFLDYLTLNERDGTLGVAPEHADHMKEVFLKYRRAKTEGSLLFVPFVTISDYLFTLRSAAILMSELGDNAVYYLAAAVSDFFIPATKMAEHKIQSGNGGLTLTMDQVPKILTPLVSQWASRGFIVSFKLETDSSLLVPKSRQALERYGHQIVIGNILTSRKHEVIFITQEEATKVVLSEEEIRSGLEIEQKIIPELIQRHDRWIAVEDKVTG